jgi:8-oxo-dGTP pyrophosphatase MutT (NUDIX family)
MNSGFKVHHAEKDKLLIKFCFDHSEKICLYPPYKTMSLGITIVVFTPDLTHFLAVQEKLGPYKGWKAPTGGVDYDMEDERAAAVREVKEETNLNIKAEDLTLVGMAPTNNLRGRSPDRNFVFACMGDNSAEIKAQESEIKQVAWISVDQFLKEELAVNHKSRPLIIQEVVRIAKKSLEKGSGWQGSQAFWGSGREAVLYHNNYILFLEKS